MDDSKLTFRLGGDVSPEDRNKLPCPLSEDRRMLGGGVMPGANKTTH